MRPSWRRRQPPTWRLSAGCCCANPRIFSAAIGSQRTVSLPTSRGSDLLVGVEYSSDYQQTMSSLGFSGLSTGNVPALADAIVAGINAHGGLLGRRVSLTFYNQSTAQMESNPASAEQAECTDFLQDHHTDFVVTTIAVTDDCCVQAHARRAAAADRVLPAAEVDAYLAKGVGVAALFGVSAAAAEEQIRRTMRNTDGGISPLLVVNATAADPSVGSAPFDWAPELMAAFRRGLASALDRAAQGHPHLRVAHVDADHALLLNRAETVTSLIDSFIQAQL